MTKQLGSVIIISIVLSVGCFCLSGYVMNESRNALSGREDCRGIDGFSPGESKCADAGTLGTVEELKFKAQVLAFCGLSLLLVSIFLPILIYNRETKSEKREVNSILRI